MHEKDFFILMKKTTLVAPLQGWSARKNTMVAPPQLIYTPPRIVLVYKYGSIHMYAEMPYEKKSFFCEYLW